MEALDWVKKFKHIYIQDESWSSPVALRLREIFPVEMVSRVNEKPLVEKEGRLSATEFTESKRLLYVMPFKGQFFKRCPGANPKMLCCNYFVLNLGQQCDMNCSYCYLQSFLNSPLLTIYSNLEDALGEMRTLAREMGDMSVRIGTGEVIDSLSLDPLTLHSRELIQFFQEVPKWTLEFKTKSALVEQFLDQPHAGNVIVSWSINPQAVIDHEEHGTASLSERLQAAKKCRDKGFQVSFHIDPMIFHPGWQENYSSLVKSITQLFKPEDVPYLSVGALRFQPEQRHMMRERFGMQSWVTQAEMFRGTDGKLRYDQSLRREMFNWVVNEFKKASPAWRIFLCMESKETWATTMGQNPFQEKSLNDLFDPKVVRTQNKLSSLSLN